MSKKFQIISLVIVAVIAFIVYIVVSAASNGNQVADETQQVQQ